MLQKQSYDLFATHTHTHTKKQKLANKALTQRMEPKAKQILNPMVHQVVTNYCRVNNNVKKSMTPTVIIYIISLVLITYISFHDYNNNDILLFN